MTNPTFVLFALRPPPSAFRLVLHADDLGMSRAIDEGILRGFRHGLLTSTSLLGNAPDVDWALQQWKTLAAEQAEGRLPSAERRQRLGDGDCPFDLGVHLNLTQGRPLSGGRYPAELLDADGRFPGVFALFARLRRRGESFRAAIRAELEQQVQVVCDHGLRPTHLNGHQYIEMMPAVARVVPELLNRFGIRAVRVAWEPLLWRSTVLAGQFWKWPLALVKRRFAERFRAKMDALEVAHPDFFFGTAHAGSVDLPLLRRFLASAEQLRARHFSLPCSGRACPPCGAANTAPQFGLVEIGLHPGEAAVNPSPTDRAAGWHDPLDVWRPRELEMLVADELATFLESAGWRLGRLATCLAQPESTGHP